MKSVLYWAKTTHRIPAPARAAVASSGFTLLELMIVLAIIAVLAAIAYPSYNAYVLRGSRAAAQVCLMQYANWMERYYTTHLSYPQAAVNAAETEDNEDSQAPANASGSALPELLDCATAQKTGSRYQYTFQTPTATSYTLRAKPIGAQAVDTQCGDLTLNQTGATGTVASCWK